MLPPMPWTGKDMPLAVYLFDLDNLKLINDTYGHVRGDQTITAFANLLRVQTRESDILSRLGGDEFVVIMKQMKSGKVLSEKGRTYAGALVSIPLTTRFWPAVPQVWLSGIPGSRCHPYWNVRIRPCIAPRQKKKEAAACGKTGMNVYRNQAAFGVNMIIRIKSGLYRRGFRVRYPGPFPVYGNI